MATRTVRFDTETEKVLSEVIKATGWPISEALKRGLRAVRDLVRRTPTRTPYDIYKELDFSSARRAIAASDDTRAGVRLALKRKLGR